MRIFRSLVVTGVLAVTLLGPGVTAAPTTAAATAATVLHSAKFTMPSGNIACLFNSGKLRCDIFSGLRPEPTKKCEFYWKGVMLPAAGKASYLCIIDTVYDPKAPTLRYGKTWKRHGIVCRSRTTGLRCHNPDQHGFLLSRARSKKW